MTTDKAIIFDTETTGIPVWNEPSGSENQPHIVQIGAILWTPGSADLTYFTAIAKPIGWVIPPETTEIHGITMERAMDEGMPEDELVSQFMDLWGQASYRVGFNETFDRRMLRIALKRYGHGAGRSDHTQQDRDEQSDFWNNAPDFCCMKTAKTDMGMKKYPKLGEALKHYTGEPQVGAHTALGDAMDTLKIFRAQLERGLVPPVEAIILDKQQRVDAKAVAAAGTRQ